MHLANFFIIKELILKIK